MPLHHVPSAATDASDCHLCRSAELHRSNLRLLHREDRKHRRSQPRRKYPIIDSSTEPEYMIMNSLFWTLLLFLQSFSIGAHGCRMEGFNPSRTHVSTVSG